MAGWLRSAWLRLQFVADAVHRDNAAGIVDIVF
jgi:hypothetical protein